jgi:hypothetical protein
MKGKTVKYRLGPLRMQRHIAASVPMNEKRLQALFDSVNKSLERASSGDSLRDYIDQIETLARGIFSAEKVTPDPIVIRCAQIVSEYEDPTLGELAGNARQPLAASSSADLPQPLPRSAISEFLYGAARVLLRINVVKATLAQSTINPWLLAAECMSVEEAHQQLIFAGAYNAEGRTRTEREVKEASARERQDRMRQWVTAHGKFPSNDKETRVALGYRDAGAERARRQFSRDLTAVYATYKRRK